MEWFSGMVSSKIMRLKKSANCFRFAKALSCALTRKRLPTEAGSLCDWEEAIGAENGDLSGRRKMWSGESLGLRDAYRPTICQPSKYDA